MLYRFLIPPLDGSPLTFSSIKIIPVESCPKFPLPSIGPHRDQFFSAAWKFRQRPVSGSRCFIRSLPRPTPAIVSSNFRRKLAREIRPTAGDQLRNSPYFPGAKWTVIETSGRPWTRRENILEEGLDRLNRERRGLKRKSTSQRVHGKGITATGLAITA